MTDTSTEAVSKRLCAFAWDYPCVHCGSPVLEKNNRGQIICCGCLNENPRDQRSEAIMDALALIDRLAAERDALRAALEKTRAVLEQIESHRRLCMQYDEQNGHVPRAFDEKDLRIMEIAARTALNEIARVV